ncbi:oligosaccharide flippase family protein [Pseudoduganella eburnea]|uniref:Oligosaccharide flippase family protein n=1 Tax=Massilia eburnea TaxID=1776165 RepID=A0A6L6QQI3_9BURK|nr:oligosaccharide flippase family protein [Massilia eburnea]MTW13946.1 oligosaccharide flippase family protein [Massilia eburnea]
MRGLARNFAFGFAEKYLQVALALASSAILARLLSPAEIGVYSIAAVLTGLAQVFRDLGTGQLLVARRDLSVPEQRALFTIGLAMGWGLALMLAALAEPLAAFYRQPELRTVLHILLLNFLLVPFSSQVTAMLRREMRAGALLKVSACYCVVQFIATIAFAVAGMGARALAWGGLAGTFTGLIAALLLQPPGMAWRPAWQGVWELVRPGSLAVTGNAIDELGVVAPDLVAGKLLGAEEVAVLGKAQSVLALFNQAVTSAVSPVIFPLFARHAREGNDPVQAYLSAASCITALSWPFFLFAGLFASPLVTLLYGYQWQASVPLIRIMCGAAALYSMLNMARYMLLATGHFAEQARIDAISVAGRLVLLVPAAMEGLQWLAAAVALSLVLRSYVVLRSLRALYGLELMALLRQMRKSAIAALAAVTPALLVLAAVPAAAGPLRMMAGAAAGALGWGAAIWLQRHPLAGFLRAAGSQQ